MKKKLSLLMALVMLILCVSACTEKTGTDESSTASENSVGTGSEAQVTEFQYETVVSVGKPYTVNIEADEKYSDPQKTELCDGFYSEGEAAYTDEKFAGFALSGTMLRVKFDMGEDSKQLYKFGISFYCSTTAGIGPLGSCRVSYSNDGEKWARCSAFFRIPEFKEGVTQQAWMTLKAPIDAKYIRFDITGKSSWLFLDELLIVSNTEGSAVNSNYLQQLSASYQQNRLPENAIVKGTDAVDRTQPAVLVSKGCKYTFSQQPDTRYPDSSDAPLLTDGNEMGGTLSGGAFLGLTGGKAVTVDLDLGKTVDGLADFDLAMFQHANLHNTLPYYVDVYVSQDKTNYDHIGRTFAPDDLAITNFNFALRLTKAVSARYVRFVLAESDSDCYLIEEAAVRKYGASDAQSLYPEVVFPQVSGEEVKPNASKKETNLVLGLPYQMSSATDLLASQELDGNTLPSAGVLTDGKNSPNTVFNNGYWNQTRSGRGRNVYFDLNYTCSVTGFKISYLNFVSYGISMPLETRMYLSDDGKKWYAAGTATLKYTKQDGIYPAEYRLDKPVKARFVCISFPVSPHSYADEIVVWGTEAVTDASIPLSELNVYPFTIGQYTAPNENLLAGVSDLALIYYNIVETNEDFFLPYVAYLDQEGKIKDTMFDGYLFLPSTRGLPSGGYPYATSKGPQNVWSDWMFQFNENFREGNDFDALNSATAKVKEALSLPNDYKVKVYATIMYPSALATDFGDVDGDGVTENLSVEEDRRKVLNTYMDMYLNKFAEAGYEHLTFGGFYWFEEAISNDNDPAMIAQTAALAESKGSQLFWIPYFTARGYADWSSYGFSVACMQPNYVFRDNVPVSQLYSAASYIRRQGMGIEIEIDTPALSQISIYKRYMRYLGFGLEAGYMKDCIHMYYQSADVYRNACYSETEMGRSIYDATHAFIKGTLTPPEKIADQSVSCKAGEVLRGTLFDSKTQLGMTELTVSAEHGTVSVAPDGTFLYIPYDGFTGTDTFRFRYSNYLNWSEDTTYTVTVE